MEGAKYFAKGGGGGGRASSGARSGSGGSIGKSSKPSASAKSSSPPPASKPPVGKSTASPGSKVTVNGKEVQSSTKKPTNSKYTSSKGIVGDNGYTPRFANGYNAPAGSVVYYPQHSALDYLPWIYLFSQHSPTHDQATIMQPDGKEVVAPPANVRQAFLKKKLPMQTK